ncbi:MAG: hypothetical protein CMH50_14160 [Myxococcales bacterium]|nr:hypothetical protein [Myxococcales bacterium]
MELRKKLTAAWIRREQMHEDPATTAYRIFHGHGDGEPRFDADRFGKAVVLWLRKNSGVDVDSVAEFYSEVLQPDTIIVKDGARDSGHVLVGSAPSGPLTIKEEGLSFSVDLLAAQNAGFFLDARPARNWLRRHSAGRRVANLFAYTGSLGVVAVAGGARSIEHVDLQTGQLRRAQVNHQLNHQRVSTRDFQDVEVGRWLRQAIKKGRSFDGIILDPPPRSPRGRARFRRERLYELAGKALSPEGWIFVFFNRRGLDPHEENEQVIDTLGPGYERFWEGRSGDDFMEPDLKNRLHFAAYRLR